MTPEELAAQIEQDIERKGRARVPMGIIQEVISVDTRASITLDAALEEFAGSHGWRVQHGNDLSTPRLIFYPVESAGNLSTNQGKVR